MHWPIKNKIHLEGLKCNHKKILKRNGLDFYREVKEKTGANLYPGGCLSVFAIKNSPLEKHFRTLIKKDTL